ncbi:hypothetical protein ACNPQM_18445 [Streptomyces sp. NPDC056231]|uniref:hypothetical protein n=1 Tax=Streptomyces sp. NPDC056231 TaxID=3345755 RepID=UPI003AAB318B
MRLYVETRIRADLEDLWEQTQNPAQHQRWDLRFTEIVCLPGGPSDAQRFRYATRVLPFLTVTGTGISAGEHRRADGERVSALRFASAHPLSLLADGSGYWRYVPTPDGIRFLTGYDYRTRWGRPGAGVDRLVFRPLMGWATAWSFDRLRLWCERGISPARSLWHALAELGVRLLAVLSLLPFGPVAAFVAVMASLLLPPLPTTPAARRCLRRPPARTATPTLLARLERP